MSGTSANWNLVKLVLIRAFLVLVMLLMCQRLVLVVDYVLVLHNVFFTSEAILRVSRF